MTGHQEQSDVRPEKDLWVAHAMSLSDSFNLSISLPLTHAFFIDIRGNADMEKAESPYPPLPFLRRMENYNIFLVLFYFI